MKSLQQRVILFLFLSIFKNFTISKRIIHQTLRKITVHSRGILVSDFQLSDKLPD